MSLDEKGTVIRFRRLQRVTAKRRLYLLLLITYRWQRTIKHNRRPQRKDQCIKYITRFYRFVVATEFHIVYISLRSIVVAQVTNCQAFAISSGMALPSSGQSCTKCIRPPFPNVSCMYNFSTLEPVPCQQRSRPSLST